MQVPLLMLTALVASSVAFYSRIPHNRVSRNFYYDVPIDDERKSMEDWCCPIPYVIPMYAEIPCNNSNGRMEKNCNGQGDYLRKIKDGKKCRECYRGPKESCSIDHDVQCSAGSKCVFSKCSGPKDILGPRQRTREGWGDYYFDLN